MQYLKLSVIGIFVLFAAAFWGFSGASPAANSKGTDGSLPAPASFTATDNLYENKVGLMWNAVRGATTYRVFRNTVNNPNTATEVGTTAAFYFFDTTAAVSQPYFYWVRAENALGNSGFSTTDQGVRATGVASSGPLFPLTPPTPPGNNQITAAKSYLGKAIFWDEQLSSTKTVACGTCHRAGEGGSDPRTIIGDARSQHPGFDQVFGTDDDVFGSPGVIDSNADGTYNRNSVFGLRPQVTDRKAPSYLNAGTAFLGLFWDGRASTTFRDPLTNEIVLDIDASLESQILGPPLSSAEMAHQGRDWTNVAARIAVSKPLVLATDVPTSLSTWIDGRTYPQLFEEAFGTPDVTPARIAMAIATHERTLFSDQTPLDLSVTQIAPLTEQEQRGEVVYNNMLCGNCHGTQILSDQGFHNIGVRPQSEDGGRFNVTGQEEDRGKFKTPGLRNVELHAPYMHNGRFATLEEVVDFYDRGGDHDAPNIDRSLIRQLFMTPEQKADLVAFMKRPMTDPRVRDELPPFDRPHLFTESDRVPQVSGTGRAGSGGSVPSPIAIEPPLVGNPSFTVAVESGLGGAPAVLVINSTDPGVGTSIPTAGSFAVRATTLAGSGNGQGYGSINMSIPNNGALSGQTFYGRWYITDPAAANGFSVSRLFSFTVFGDAPVGPTVKAPYDFDADGKTDIAVFRPEGNIWFAHNSSTGAVDVNQFGLSTDKMVAADYDGDGKTDRAVYRNGTWHIVRSLEGPLQVQFGLANDIPYPADFDGDGKADIALFRPSTGVWYMLMSTNGFSALQFGANGDIPVAADFDGDEKADIAVYRGGIWFILKSTGGTDVLQFGLAEDKPVVGDYDADGKADIAVWRPSNGVWYYLNSGSGNSFAAFQFGLATDKVTPGDYDGDGKSDFAIFRNGVWYIHNSTTGSYRFDQFGATGDRPVPGSLIQ